MERVRNLPKMEDLIKGRVYKISCRNLAYGVWDGDDGFIGIREKFGSLFLFTEYHFDTGAPHGTVAEAIDTGIDVPEDIHVVDHLPVRDKVTERLVAYDGEKMMWYFTDTGEHSDSIDPRVGANEKLFQFLKDIETQQGERAP